MHPNQSIVSTVAIKRARRSLVVLLLTVALLVPTEALAQEVGQEPPSAADAGSPAPAIGGSPGGLPFSLPDPKQWAGEVFNQVLVNLLQGMAGALRGVVEAVLGSPLNFVTHTPPSGSYDSPSVRTLWGVVRAIANAALAIVAMWGGISLIARQQLGSPYHEAMELFPRIAVGALLANTSLAWGQVAIDANNALAQAVGNTSLPAWDRADVASQLMVDLFAVLIYLVAGLLLMLQMLMRLALVDVLLVVSPIALLCWVLPETQSWARLWCTTFFGVVFVQFVQVLALKLGGSLLTDITPQTTNTVVLANFLGMAVIALTLKLPDLLRNHMSDGLGFARYVAYRAGARAIDQAGTQRGH